MQQITSLGVDQVRISVIWAAVAPNPTSFTKPSFDATDPNAYPAGAWDRYDTLVRDAAQDGISVMFDVTSPAPYWGATKRAPSGSGFQKNYSPSPALFAQFVQAVGRRYNGQFVAPAAPPPPPPPSFLGLPIDLSRLFGNPPIPANPNPLPAVHAWEIWNEPNIGGWLTPQWRYAGHGHWLEAAPATYRSIVDGAFTALQSTGHSSDEILIGETAARGVTRDCEGCSMRPMQFVRALYCVNSASRPLTGTRARQLGCPTSRQRSAFVSAHPGLFNATGYGHHPYSFTMRPNANDPDPNDVPLMDLSRLERALNAIFAGYHRPRSSNLPLYLTEYGYKSNPPNPYATFSQAQQAAFINQGEYMAWLDPRVQTSAQFLLVDDAPKAAAAAGTPSYWSTFQTGLVTQQGAQKPAFGAYRVPIFLPDARHGHRVLVWGHLRPARRGSTQTATIQFAPRGSTAFTTLASVQTANPEGFLSGHVTFPSAGAARIAWTDPATGAADHSRAATVS